MQQHAENKINKQQTKHRCQADHYLKEKFNAENVFEGMKDLHTAAVRFEKLFDEA